MSAFTFHRGERCAPSHDYVRNLAVPLRIVVGTHVTLCPLGTEASTALIRSLPVGAQLYRGDVLLAWRAEASVARETPWSATSHLHRRARSRAA
jgi:hypothetical protein